MYNNLEYEHKDFIPNKYFKIICEDGKEFMIPKNRYLLNRKLYHDRKKSYYIVFNYYNIYKSSPNSLKKYTKEFKILQFILSNTKLKESTKYRYCRGYDKIGSRIRYQFDRLFNTGIEIDLNHSHGGEHNKHLLFHIGHKNRFVVNWLCNLFGFEYGAGIYDWAKRMILFDSSGADTNSLELLHDLFKEYNKYNSTGLELLKNCGIIKYKSPKATYWNYSDSLKKADYMRIKRGGVWQYFQTIIKQNIYGENVPKWFKIKERLDKNQLLQKLLVTKVKSLNMVGGYMLMNSRIILTSLI